MHCLTLAIYDRFWWLVDMGCLILIIFQVFLVVVDVRGLTLLLDFIIWGSVLVVG